MRLRLLHCSFCSLIFYTYNILPYSHLSSPYTHWSQWSFGNPLTFKTTKVASKTTGFCFCFFITMNVCRQALNNPLNCSYQAKLIEIELCTNTINSHSILNDQKIWRQWKIWRKLILLTWVVDISCVLLKFIKRIVKQAPARESLV